MDGHEQAYQNKFNETMDTEARVKALEVKVAELRRQTDLTYQVLDITFSYYNFTLAASTIWKGRSYNGQAKRARF